jgi:single-stranded DNA-binding protein
MIRTEIIGFISKDAEMRTTPGGKEYAFFTVVAKDEKEKEYFYKCYLYGCSERRCKSLKLGIEVSVWGKQNVSIFEKDNGEKEINFNLNVDDIHFHSKK